MLDIKEKKEKKIIKLYNWWLIGLCATEKFIKM